MAWVIVGTKVLMKIRFGLRAKLFLLSSFLFTIPWFGYQYVWEMEKYLRFGQEQTLVGTARALATALHERPNLFNNQASFLPSVEQGKDLYGYQLKQAIHLDGLNKDWPEFSQRAHYYGVDHQINTDDISKAPLSTDALTLHFTATVGKYDKYLYLLFSVVDDKVIYRGKNSRGIQNNDHLEIAFNDENEKFSRYIISNKKPGWLSTYRITDIENNIPEPTSFIQGQWLATPQGYNIELRIPLTHIGDNLAFVIHDVDSPNGDTLASVGSANPTTPETLGTILVPSPEIERIVKGMRYTHSSIWVVDQHHRVLASAGDLKTASGVWQSNSQNNSDNKPRHLWQQFEQQFLLPLYYTVLTKPPSDFIDKLYDAGHLSGKHIEQALLGQAKSQWRLSSDQQAVVLSAAYPIFINNKVQGAVIVEENTNGIRTLRNRALEKLFSAIIGIMVLGALTFTLFSSRISSRIRSLSSQAERAIDEHGRITHSVEPSTVNDEIGDLSRSFSTAVNRLSQYNHYLENMSSRLSHELRTPIAVVKTSLESLTMQGESLPESVKAYLERAQTGINTLNLILTNMSEATRLEQMLHNTEKTSFDLNTVLTGCVMGYQQVYPKITFTLDNAISPENNISLPLYGSPEHIVQLLDKVVNNAVEFSRDNHVSLHLEQHKKMLQLTISNQGVLLPDEMKDRLFDSMVSVRDNSRQAQPHLGLGLYIARLICEFHQGKISAKNHLQPDGVSIIIELPLSDDLS